MPRSPRQQSLPLTAAASPDPAPPSPAALATGPVYPPQLRFETGLGSSPELQSCSDLAEALDRIGQIDARRKAIESIEEAELAKITRDAAHARHVEVDGFLLTHEEYRSRLIEAVKRFVPEHKAEVFTGDTQTAKFAGGTVSWKRINTAVRLAEEVRGADIADRLATRKKLKAAVDAVLKKLGLDGWLRVEIVLDLAGIQQRFKDGQLKAKQLPAGLIVTPERDEVSVKPLPQPERSDVAA